jgi:Cu(I)/Ag(I) efflux system membrane fusion protein/cobalt-zinc-cadmium efflux system membrane fusion protein
MKKTLLLVFVFALGIGATVTVLANPFDWGWMRRTASLLPGTATAPPATAERRILYWRAPMDPTYIRDKPGKSPMGMDLIPVYADEGASQAAPAGERKVKYWRAPMDPTYIRDRPGKSPMGMDLVPVYEDEAVETPPGWVEIDPGFVQNIGVQTTDIVRADIPFTIRTVATLTYNDQQVAWVNTKYDGWIEKAYVNYVGETVTAGQKLFEIYSPQLVTTQKEYLQALEYAARLATQPYPDIAQRAASLVDSARQRLRYWDISDAQIAELERTREPRRTLAVVSNVNGLVVQKMDQALEGMFVKTGMNLYKIANLSTVWAEAEVFEGQAPWLQVGQQASLELPYQPGRTYTGRVRYIYPFLSNKTRTLRVSIELPNPGLELRADMYADVTLAVPSAQQVLVVPTEAVIRSGRRDVVVIALGGGRFQVREVELGVSGDGVMAVTGGVSEGERVVVSAQFLIDSESNLREAIRKITSAPPAAGAGGPDVGAHKH